ncbi:MAG: GAF domain-containing protein [Gammaproteobacteria bacterium]|nr:GAF domain-containing protein [Gammaproteobacteria bacterium]
MTHKKFPESYYRRVVSEILTQIDLLKQTGNPEQVLEDTLEMLSQLLHLNRGRVFLWDDYSQSLHIRYAYNLSTVEMSKGKYEICEGITGEVFDTQNAALIEDINAVTNYKGKVTPRKQEENSPKVSYIAVPIVHKDSSLGVLAVETIAHYDGDMEANALILRMVAEMFAEIIDTYDLTEFLDTQQVA